MHRNIVHIHKEHSRNNRKPTKQRGGERADQGSDNCKGHNVHNQDNHEGEVKLKAQAAVKIQVKPETTR